MRTPTHLIFLALAVLALGVAAAGCEATDPATHSGYTLSEPAENAPVAYTEPIAPSELRAARVGAAWAARFSGVGLHDVEARIRLYRSYLDEVDEPLSRGIVAYAKSHLFDRSTVRFLLARTLNRAGDFEAASEQYAQLLDTASTTVPHRRIAALRAINDLGLDVDRGVAVPAERRPELRLAQLVVERALPSDKYDERLSYNLGVLAYLTGHHEEVIERFAPIAARWQAEGEQPLLDDTELHISRSAIGTLLSSLEATKRVDEAIAFEPALRKVEARLGARARLGGRP